MQTPEILGIIAGNGVYPRILAAAARKGGVKKIVAAAFTDETDPAISQHADVVEWLRVGQLGRLLKFFREHEVHRAIMAGQISPFLENERAAEGLIAGAKLSRAEEEDVDLGWSVAKEIARLDIGQTIIVKNGTVLAVEAFEGTNDAIKRGGALAREGAVMIKVAKPNQDMRFDVPVIGIETVKVAAGSKLRVIAIESGKTLLLERDAIVDLARRADLSIVAR